VNLFLKYAPLFIVSLFLIVLILSIKVMVSSPFYRDSGVISLEEKSSHYAFFLPVEDYSFFKQIKEGAVSASETLDCSISFFSIDDDPISLGMVPYLGFDGICLYPYGMDDKVKDSINKISNYGIPLIQLENEIVRNETTFFIGTNNFDSGKAIGKIAQLANKDLYNIVLIYSDKNPGLLSGRSLVEMGLKSVLEDKVDKLYVRKTDLNPLDAERLAYEIVKNSPEIDLIVLSDPNDTLVAVQAIIDNNLVGKIQIIGFGDDSRILEYINKDIILGTIVRNPYRIGYSAVLALDEIEKNGYTSAYVDTGINLISKKSLLNGKYSD